MNRLDYDDALAEFSSAALWYRQHSPVAAQRFADSVERTAAQLLEFPRSGRAFGGRLRRVIVPGFPYGLVYRIDAERIYIVAVMHLARRPGYWRPRL